MRGEKKREKKPLHSKGQKKEKERKKMFYVEHFWGGEKLGVANKLKAERREKKYKKSIDFEKEKYDILFRKSRKAATPFLVTTVTKKWRLKNDFEKISKYF